MILDNLTIRGETGKKQILIGDGHINTIIEKEPDHGPLTGEEKIFFDDAIVLPGLINSHDHLDFNLFPQLGNRKYNNYKEWGADIHTHNKAAIDAVSKIPVSLRTEWGKYKNLLNGFTTVVNHGNKIKDTEYCISVFEDCYPLHSPGFEKFWKEKLNNPFQFRRPYVMHVGEGTDNIAKAEIGAVIRANLFDKKLIAIHGIQMNRIHASSFAGLIWCPASNYFLTGKTAAVQELKSVIPVVFGTDSTLSAPWNAWQHFREGIAGTGIQEDELIAMLTEIPAALWGLSDRGKLATGKRADLLIVKNKKPFFTIDPEDILLVIHKGQIRLYDASLAPQLQWQSPRLFSRITLNGHVKFVQGDLPGLISTIRSFHPAQDFPVDI